ncbi:tape measure protein [Empedobacter sp. GD03739]|uniref:tape measure protein n=1 Tax=Empedobacter sp. GD03739 TaxID=2975376 RepID=UPI0024491AC2|nr:tape measure protein [Empedobacter sp. GD03739]MDH1602369.1 tape measure protein [Empedobacter sp. GD03739]
MDINNGIGYTITLDNKQVQQILRQTKQDFESFNTHVQNQFTQTTGVVNTLAKGVAAFLTVDYATQFVSQLVKVRGEFEQLEIAFTTMLGSKEKADSLMQEIVTFAATTPFGLQSTSEATKMLLAYGESADTALDTMRKLGDIASGVGIPLKDIAYLYGTTMTQGRLYTQDLNQFLGRGIPMMDELAKILGVSKNEVKGLVEAGKVGFPEVQKVIENLTASGSMFGGLMEAQSKSVAGQIEQLKDAVDVMFNEIGKDSQGFVTSVISGASSVVENYEAIGKTIAVLVATYGTYKAVLIVLNVIEKARLTTTLAIGAAEGRVTAMQALRYVSTLKLTAAQTALNAAMMANPYAIVITAVVALGSAYYFLADHTSAAEKAQESYNKTQEEVKSKLDETKQKAEEYISILKDETATVYQQIEAYKALQLLKLKGFEKLSLEQIQAMDINEIKKLVNEANDVKGLDLQKQKLSDIEGQIKSIKSQIDNANKANGQGGLALDGLYNKLDVLNNQYNQQLTTVNQIDREMKFANMTLEQKRVYWENIISTTEKQISTIQEVNIKQNDTNNLANQVSNAFLSWDVSRLNFQLNEAQKQLIAINGQINSAVPEIKNKSYWDTKKSDATSKRDKLDPKDPRNKEEWNKLTNEINEADNALKAWGVTSTKVAKPKSIKPATPKKADDPVEIYKKQISAIQEQYERYLKILDANDISFATEKAILQAQLSSKGKTYEEYLRTQQKELSKTAEISEIARKKLSFVNDELLKLINHSEVEIFKNNLDKQLDNVDSVVEKLKIIDDVKNELSSNTNELTAPKIEFIDKTQLELLEQLDKVGKDLVASLGGGYSQLQKLTNEYNNDILILTESLKNAKTEAEKTVINDSIWKRGVKFAEDSKDLPTNDDNYNKLLLEFKSFEQKKSDITLDFDNKISVAKLNNDKKLEEQLLQEKKKALSKIALEQMKSSESFVKLLGDLDKMSVKSLDKLIKEIESQLDNPEIGLEMSAEDIKIILDQLQKAKDEISKKNPFKAIQEGWNDFWNATTDDDKLEALDEFMSGVNSVFEATKEIMDMTTDAVEAFGGKLDDSAKQTIQSVQNIVNGVENAIQGYFKGDWAQMVAGIAQVVVEVAKIIGGSKDKRLEKRIKKQQEAVKELKRAYDELSFSIERALGGKEYSMQKDQIKNLEEQKVLMEQMIKNEEKKKKTDRNKINEWEDAIADIDRQIIEIQENIANDILQTSAKELASTLGDALAEAFGKGEDAAKSFEKVANDVLKNAVLNQLKKRYIEEELQKALDQLEKDMGVDEKGWDGLSPEEQQEFRDKIEEISQNFQGALEQYSDLFKDLEDPNETAMAGAIKGMSEETGNALLGQFNAIRILQKELVTINIDSNKILLNSLDRLANIDYNTRSVLPLLEKLINRIDNAGRAYGF